MDQSLYLVAALILLTTMIPTIAVEDNNKGGNDPESLPKPQGYRIQPPRRTNSYASWSDSRHSNSGDDRASAYDLKAAYDLLSDNRASLTRPSSSKYSGDVGNSDYDNEYYKLSKQDMYDGGNADYANIRSSPSEYGGYGSESGGGYGLSCASGYVNASAVALLAFLFLLNIVQDVIQQITAGRRKRDVNESGYDDEQTPAMQFLADGGLEALQEGLPDILIPLLVKMVDSTEPKCLQKPLCEANVKLTGRYGDIGKVVAYLSSNVISKAFSGALSENFHLVQYAASVGRGGEEKVCQAFPTCGYQKYSKEANKQNFSSTSDNDDSVVIDKDELLTLSTPDNVSTLPIDKDFIENKV